MDVSEIKAVEIKLIKIFLLGLVLVVSFMAIMGTFFDFDKCNCYTIPVLTEWVDEPGFTGKTKDHTMKCSSCIQRDERKNELHREYKW